MGREFFIQRFTRRYDDDHLILLLVRIWIFDQGCSTLHCKVYREAERRKQKQINGLDVDLIGFVSIPLSTITGNQFIEQWYPLQVPHVKEKSQKIQDGLFNIRIKSKYQTIEILPIGSYLHLQDVNLISNQ